MKVFISWSGEQSERIAEIFRNWLPKVIQTVEPFYSSQDIRMGERWNTEISKELENSKIGLIVLTRENLDKPWIMYEAGALSKYVDKSKVCPILFGLDPTDIQGPLVQFHAAKFSKEGVKKFLETINSEEKILEKDILNSTFDKWWPDIEKEIIEELSKEPQSNKTIRKERDILEEILSLIRSIMSLSQFDDLRTKKQMVAQFYDALESSRKAVLAINTSIPYNNDLWGQQKSEQAIEEIIKILDLLDKKEIFTVSNKMRYLLWAVTKIYSFFCDATWNENDVELILKERESGFESIKKQYKS